MIVEAYVQETFQDVKPLLVSAVRKCQHMSNLSYDDLEQVAYDVFIDCYFSWKPESAFSSWLYTQLRFRLMDYLKEQHRQAPVDPILMEESETIEDFQEGLKWEDFSEDARTVIDFALHMQPIEKRAKCTATMLARMTRQFIRKHFLENGWSMVRVTEAFNEISNALATIG